mmetsp:Transcript_37521/g.27272  ORF Transcript_37521/g.27272 Transcript_37521/m.27272 type:complete len:159 (+) Transcript_37521:367-843(+)
MGYAYDIVGRRITIYLGFVLASIVFMFMPYTAPNYAYLLVLRIMFNIFIQGPLGSPLVADYFKKSAIGKAHVIGYIGFVIGEVVAVTVLFRITDHMPGRKSFFIVGVITIIIASSLLCMIQEPKIRLSRNYQIDSEGEKDLEDSMSEDEFSLSNRQKP